MALQAEMQHADRLAAPSDWHPEGQFALVIDERSK
jgi:hypothetical protein